MNSLVFPGQGSQFPGMGKEIYESRADIKEMMNSANDILGFNIIDIMFNGTVEQLIQTKVTQPAIFIYSIASAKVNENSRIEMENYNFPGLIVISGHTSAVKHACELLKEKGAKRAIMLPVSGAFHSPLMSSAQKRLEDIILKTKFNTPSVPIYQNYTSKAVTHIDEIKENLIKQLTSPVNWTKTIRNMIQDNCDVFVETGPGKVLQGLIKKIDNTVEVTSLSN